MPMTQVGLLGVIVALCGVLNKQDDVGEVIQLPVRTQESFLQLAP